MKQSKLALLGLALATLAVPALARVHKHATSTSHELEHAAAELHHYMHDAFPSSYGAHGMEVDAGTAHGVLHDFGHGEATEAEVDAAVQMVNDSLEAMRVQFRDNNVWADQEAKKHYDEVHKLTVRLTAYTK